MLDEFEDLIHGPIINGFSAFGVFTDNRIGGPEKAALP